MMIYSKFGKSGWVLIGSIPQKIINKKTSATNNDLIILLITFFLLIIVLAVIISRTYLGPIRKITKLFIEIQRGTIDTSMKLETRLTDEIGQLVTWFNAFLESMKSRKLAEEALDRELRNDFRRTVQNQQGIVFKLKQNMNGAIVFTLFEGKIAKELNLSSDKVYEKLPIDIFNLEIANKIEFNSKKAFTGDPVSFEISLIERIFYVTLSPVIENSKIVEVVGSGIDITELKIAEKKIKFMA